MDSVACDLHRFFACQRGPRSNLLRCSCICKADLYHVHSIHWMGFSHRRRSRGEGQRGQSPPPLADKGGIWYRLNGIKCPPPHFTNLVEWCLQAQKKTWAYRWKCVKYHQKCVKFACNYFNKKLSWCWQTRATHLGQSRSPNSSIPYDRYSFLLCNSNFVFKTRRFYDIRLQKMSWPWNRGQRWLKVIGSGTILYTGYSFQLVFYRNFVLNTDRFWDRPIRFQ